MQTPNFRNADGSVSESALVNTGDVPVAGIVRTGAASLVASFAALFGFSSAGGALTSMAAPAYAIEVASAARTVSGNSGIISVPTGGAISGNIAVSAASGTTPTLDITLEESLDNGSTWQQVWAATRITGAGTTPIPLMTVSSLRRWVWAVAGGTPSFTFSINVNQSSVSAPLIKSLIDRAISPNTLNSATAALNIDGCAFLTLFVVSGAGATTAPVYGIQISPDGTNWADSGISVSVPASSSQTISMTGIAAKFARAFIKTAGVAATQTYAELKALG